MSEPQSQIPENWIPTNIGEICTALQYGYTASASEHPCGPRFLRITDIQDGQVQWSSVPYCNIGDDQTQKYELHVGDIVFARTGGTVGKSFIISAVPEQSVFASYLIRLSAHSEIEPKFLYYFFQSASYWEQIGFKKGGLQGNVNATTLSSLELFICPQNEQLRIVAKIEELFSELDKGVEGLKIARQQLKVFRQAVLKHAFEGKLTAQWREEKKDKLVSPDQLLDRIKQEREARYQQKLADWKATVKEWETKRKKGKKPMSPTPPKPVDDIPVGDLREHPLLPQEWVYTRLGLFLDGIEAGKSFKCDERQPLESEIGVAKVSAVTWGEYDESESKTCVDANKENPDYFINVGDFLLSRANTIDLVGACVVAKKVTRRIMLSDKTLRLIFGAGNKSYFLHYLRSHMGRNEIMKRSTGNQESMRNIGQDRIRNIVMPLCSEIEISTIVQQLEENFGKIEMTENAIAVELERAEALRQSILKSAFSGHLVAQDPNDEPASVLLERIRAEKEEQANDKKNNKREAAA